MKKRDLFSILGILDQMNNEKTQVKFAYAMAKNRKKIQAEVEVLRESVKSSPEMEEFEKKRLVLCHDMAQKDDEGKPLTKGGAGNLGPMFVIADQEAFNTAFDALKEEYKDALELQDLKRKEFEALLDEEAETELHKIPLDVFPNNISTAQMEWLMYFVEE
jgi:hypothetical protein